MLSDKSLSYRPFINSTTNGTWYNSTLRKWLNQDFMETAFSKEEQQKIIISTISTSPNPTYGTLGGQDTKDKLFLLSIEEVETYFPIKQNRFAIPSNLTAESISQLSGYTPSNGWCLRSPGMNSEKISCISKIGEINTIGTNTTIPIEIRPAMWITVSDLSFL